MRRILVILGVVALVAPATLWAQEELTLEGLAAQLTALSARVERVEALWEGPGAVEVDATTCSIGMPDSLQDETALLHKEKFDEWVDMNSVWPIDIRHSTHVTQ